jgi:hypothetical protein
MFLARRSSALSVAAPLPLLLPAASSSRDRLPRRVICRGAFLPALEDMPGPVYTRGKLKTRFDVSTTQTFKKYQVSPTQYVDDLFKRETQRKLARVYS